MNSLSKNNLLKENFSNKKNLVVLVGHLRSIEYLLKYHKKLLDVSKSDLAISTWSDENDRDDLQEKIINSLSPVFFETEQFNFNMTIKIFGELNKFDLMFGKAALSTRSQIYKILRIGKIIEILEIAQQKKYEIVIKSRPDLFLNSNLNLKNLGSKIIFESTVGDWKKDRSDRLFFAKRDQFITFINCLPKYAMKSWDEEIIYPILHLIPLQEQFIKYCCDKEKFDIEYFFPVIKVWRPQKEPTLKDIFNIRFRTIFKSFLLKIKILLNI